MIASRKIGGEMPADDHKFNQRKGGKYSPPFCGFFLQSSINICHLFR